MSDQEIKSNLCYNDRENPNNNLDAYDEEDRPQPRNGCGCDNCFYGRDKLAMQILEMQRECDEALRQCTNFEEIIRGEWPEDQAEELIRHAKEAAK